MTPAADAGFPGFFAEVPSVTLRDPLAQFLGAAEQGQITYRYVDAVRLAGHSCPTVAEAYLMTRHGLRALYGSELPVRGEIDAFLRDACDSGVTGVIASVVQLLTGAAAESGFRGIGAARRWIFDEFTRISKACGGRYTAWNTRAASGVPMRPALIAARRPLFSSRRLTEPWVGLVGRRFFAGAATPLTRPCSLSPASCKN